VNPIGTQSRSRKELTVIFWKNTKNVRNFSSKSITLISNFFKRGCFGLLFPSESCSTRSEVYFGTNNSALASVANNENLTQSLTIIKIMESIFQKHYHNFKMMCYTSSLYSDIFRNLIIRFRWDFAKQKNMKSEFNFGRHGRTVQW
jgi:hypothetical protein